MKKIEHLQEELYQRKIIKGRPRKELVLIGIVIYSNILKILKYQYLEFEIFLKDVLKLNCFPL